MTTWLWIAIIAQFIFALTILIDKHIVVRAEHIGKPAVYAFYSAFLSGFVVVLVPFGYVSLPNSSVMLLSVLSGVTFLGGIYCLYSALRLGHASDVAPVTGAVSAIATIVLAAALLDSDITPSLFFPVAFLVAGTALIAHFHFTMRALLYIATAGSLLGATLFLSKLIFLQTDFFNGFFWPRFMTMVVASLLLLIPAARAVILKGGTHSTHRAKFLVVANKTLAGVGSFLTAIAVSLGSVSIVNSLSGLQFVFLFFLTFIFAPFMPGPNRNTSHVHVGLGHTAGGILCIVAGLALLYWINGV